MNSETCICSRLVLINWGLVMHICVSKLTIIGLDNGLSPGRRQAIIRTNAGILLLWPLGTNFREVLVEILIFSFKKMRLKVSSAKRQPFCLDLNELRSFTQEPPQLKFWISLMKLQKPTDVTLILYNGDWKCHLQNKYGGHFVLASIC